MPHIIRIDSIDWPGVEPYASLTEAQLRARSDAAPLLARCPGEMPVFTGSRELL